MHFTQWTPNLPKALWLRSKITVSPIKLYYVADLPYEQSHMRPISLTRGTKQRDKLSPLSFQWKSQRTSQCRDCMHLVLHQVQRSVRLH